MGVYAPFGGSVGWPQDTGFRTVGTTGEVTYVRINPVIALKLAPNFSVAAGLTVNYAHTDLQQGAKNIPRPPNYFLFQGDGWGAGFNLGALWQISDKVSVGTTYRSSTPIKLDGHTEVQKLPQVPTRRRDASLEYDFPIDAAFGISYRPTPKWNLEFNADWTDWSSFSTLTIAQSSGVPSVTPQDINLTLDWQPSWLYGVGVTRYLGEKWHVSAGYAFDQNSIPDKYYTPVVPDMNLHFFSAGAGYKGKWFNVDLAYQFGYGPSRTVAGSTPSSAAAQNAGQTADGTYALRSHAVLLTVGVNF